VVGVPNPASQAEDLIGEADGGADVGECLRERDDEREDRGDADERGGEEALACDVGGGGEHGGLGVGGLLAEEVCLCEEAGGFEVFERFVGGGEDFGGGFGDEGGGCFLWFPDDVDIFGVFEGVLEFSFDA